MKKMVIEFSSYDDKTRSKALQVAVSFHGVQSVSLGDKNKSQIEVVGDLDPVRLTASLRKKLGKCPYISCFLPKTMMAYVNIVSVSDAAKKEEKKEEKKDETKPPTIAWPAPSMPLYVYDEYPYRCCIL